MENGDALGIAGVTRLIAQGGSDSGQRTPSELVASVRDVPKRFRSLRKRYLESKISPEDFGLSRIGARVRFTSGSTPSLDCSLRLKSIGESRVARDYCGS
jgi:hypothetical protein